jgi:hypothetical protein
MKACLLIRTQPGKHNEITEAVQSIEGVKLAFPVLGRTDVAASVEMLDLKKLTEIILRILVIDGVAACETLIGLEE